MVGGASSLYGQMSRIPTSGVVTELVFVERPGKVLQPPLFPLAFRLILQTPLHRRLRSVQSSDQYVLPTRTGS